MTTYRSVIHESIEYPLLVERHGAERIDELVQLMLDVICSRSPTVRIERGDCVSYAYAVRYLKLAYEYLKQRESRESALICEHIQDLHEKFSDWMVSLSDWKEQHGVRRITPYQAKRFAKWLTESKHIIEGD